MLRTHRFIDALLMTEEMSERALSECYMVSLTEGILLFQVLFPTLWSLSLRSGTASQTPARSARPWWIICTRTRHAGASYDTHKLQTHKHTPNLRSPGLKEAVERMKTSLNLYLVSWGVLSSFLSWGRGVLIHLLFHPLLVALMLWKWERSMWPGLVKNGSLFWM